MKTSLILALCLSAPKLAFAGQNFSHSLTECSAIYTAMLTRPQAVARNACDGGAQIKETAVAYLDRAMQEARREGLSRPEIRIAQTHSHLMQKWSQKVYKASAMAETENWLDYCQSFGAHLGLPTLRTP